MRRRITFRMVWRALGFVAGAALLAVAAAWYVSEDVRYVVRAGYEEARILLRRTSIAELVADSTNEPGIRSKLALVLEVRTFAADSLGLDAGGTFTTYAPVDRDTLVLVLTASRYDRLAEYRWRYPVVGEVPYKGFFDLEHAQAEARRLERIGMDSYLRPSPAFSTLGWFEDPLLSTVLGEDSVELAATVIHEILHGTVWVPGQVAFNESLANFVGYRGAEAFFRSRGDDRNAARAAARWRDERRLGRFWGELAARLEALYAPGIAGPTLREERLRVFRQAQAELAGSAGRAFETIDGAALARRPVNNAAVIAHRLYRTQLEAFERLLAPRGRTLREVIAGIATSVEGAGDPWAAVTASR